MASSAVPRKANVFPDQTVFVYQSNVPKNFTEKNAKRVTGLGVTQLAAGIFAIAFQAAATGFWQGAGESHKYNFPFGAFTGSGFWLGAMCLIDGLLGVLAGKRNQGCLIANFLVCNIVIAVITRVVLGFTASSLDNMQDCLPRQMVRSRSDQYIYDSSPAEYKTSYYTDYVEDCSLRDWKVTFGPVWIAMHSLLLLLAIFEFAIAVASAVYCCRALPCCAPHVHFAQPSAIRADSSIQGAVFTNTATIDGPVDFSTGLSSVQLHPQFVHEAMPSAPVNGACTSSGQYTASTLTAPPEHPSVEMIRTRPIIKN